MRFRTHFFYEQFYCTGTDCEEEELKLPKPSVQDWLPFWEDVAISHGT